MPDLSTTYLGLSLANPLVPSASPQLARSLAQITCAELTDPRMLLEDHRCPRDRTALVLWKDWDRVAGEVRYFECGAGHYYPAMRDPISGNCVAFSPLSPRALR
jgi:hypothetical protein